jgi:H+-translocating NAD(P) transhydrogenase subunit alpha
MAGLSVGVVKESARGEQRVAVVPDAVARLQSLGFDVLVESGAGERAWHPDAAYAAVGARIADASEVYAGSGIVVCIRRPQRSTWKPEQVLVGLLRPLADPLGARALAEADVTAVSLDLLPRTLSRAQSMDALTSQANVAGYKAALIAADTYGGYFPMLMTAAGTVRPASVLVVGAGVAGLQAIGTARRLGAMVTGYDVRAAAKAEVESTGASFLELRGVESTAGTAGYADALSAEQQRAQVEAMDRAVSAFDVVITTAQVPRGRPPLIVSRAALDAMRPGSVVVDLAVGELGGNVEGSEPDTTVVTDAGVTIVGAGELAATMPRAASTAYARNITALLAHLAPDGHLAFDSDDEITAGVLVSRGGRLVHPAVVAAADERHEPADRERARP